jgi:hypothetical protein
MIGTSILLAMGLVAAAGSTADLVLHDCDFGEVYAFTTAECHLGLENSGNRSVAVDLSVLYTGDAIEPATLTVPARSSAEATVRIATRNAVGMTVRSIRIHRQDGAARDAYARASGFVMSALDDPRPTIAFGNVDLPADGTEKSVELGSRDTANFRILRVLEKPAALDTRVGSDGRTVSVRLRPDATWGVLDDDIKLAIDTPHQNEAWIHVSGDIRGEVVPEKNPYWFGGVPAGHNRSVLVPLTDRQRRDFRIGRIELKRMDAKVDVVSCQPAAQGCQAIRLRVADSQRPGITRGELDVEFPEPHRHLNLRIWGILQPPEANGSQVQSTAQPAEESAPWTPSIVEFIKTPVRAPVVDSAADTGSAPSTLPAPGTGPLLKWAATDEKHAYGYQIFRADAESGPFVRVNPHTILVHPIAYATYPYLWRDISATVGHTYWYYVGVVYKDGHKQPLSKPQKTFVKETPVPKG